MPDSVELGYGVLAFENFLFSNGVSQLQDPFTANLPVQLLSVLG